MRSDPPARVTDGPVLDAQQYRANTALWRGRGRSLVSAYANRDLRPVEVLLLVRYREALSRRVLELGCGAGRLTGYLVEIASSVVGIDISRHMVAYCRTRYPGGTFREGDMRKVGSFERGSFEAVVLAYNILDVLSDEDRGTVLDGIHSILTDEGLLIFSSHNRAYAPRLAEPLKLRGLGVRRSIATAIRLPRWRRNRRRVLPFEHVEGAYAVLNDVSHDFSALNYYISRDAQESQLAEHGFELLECLDLEGKVVRPREMAGECSELHYVARRSASARPPH
jgi:SAM-dependent methyltransferase